MMKKIVLVNQTSGFLVVDDLNAYCAKYDSVSVLCSSLRPGMRSVTTIGQVAQREWRLGCWHPCRYSSSYSSSIEIVK